MLKKSTFRIYSLLFYLVSIPHLVPYNWRPKAQILYVPNSRSKQYFWRVIAGIQIGHFAYLALRVVDSSVKGMKPSVILFQLVWNALFMIPVLAQISTSHRKQEIAAVVTEWLQIESLDAHITKNTLQSFFMICLPTGGLHSAAHAFNYIQNPFQPQYIISVFAEYLDLDTQNLAFITLFEFLEITLATLNWTLTVFYVSFLFGCASTIEANVRESMTSEHSSSAIERYKAIQNFGYRYGDAMALAIVFMKIILFSCLVICVYNTIICDLPWLPFLLMPLTVVACSTVFIFCFPPLCKLYNQSEECIRKWRESTGQSAYDKKQWNSFRPMRINVGKFYKLERMAVLTFFDLIISSVINIILLFPTDSERMSIENL